MMSPDLMWEIRILTNQVKEISEKANLHLQDDRYQRESKSAHAI